MMGVSDIPLNKEGLRQAKIVAMYLKAYPIDRIITSPLVRARETAQVIQTHHPHIELKEIPDLHERSFGILEGLKYEEANARFPQIILGSMWQYPNFRPPHGESLADVTKRAQKVIKRFVADYSGQTIVVVSHGSFIRNFIAVLLNLPLEEINKYGFANASVSVVRYSPRTGGEAHVLNKSAE